MRAQREVAEGEGLFFFSKYSLRKEKGIRQDDFLSVDGISHSTIGMIETCKTAVTLSKIKIIAKVLGVHPRFEE